MNRLLNVKMPSHHLLQVRVNRHYKSPGCSKTSQFVNEWKRLFHCLGSWLVQGMLLITRDDPKGSLLRLNQLPKKKLIKPWRDWEPVVATVPQLAGQTFYFWKQWLNVVVKPMCSFHSQRMNLSKQACEELEVIGLQDSRKF